MSTHVGGVAVDHCGASLVAGRMQADRTPGAERGFVSKYRPDGKLAWIEISDHELGDKWQAATTDGDRALVAGSSVRRREHWDEADSDSVIASLSTDGDWLWRRNFDDGIRGSAGHIIWLPDDEHIVASGYGDQYWLRVLDAGGRMVSEELAIPDVIRGLARAPGGFVAATRDYVARYDAEGIELRRHTVTGGETLTVDAHERILLLRANWEIDVAEITWEGDVTIWPLAPADDGMHVEAMGMDDTDAVLAGFVTIDDRRVPWARRYRPDRTMSWTWYGNAAGEREVSALAVGNEGSVVVAGSTDASIHSGGIDTDLWIGGIAR